jgi:phenylpyruvate tautomerase PptA (4-oxalocrotonate tautomerase family)
MPMLDAYIPDGALAPDAERSLLSELTDILLRNEGADPADPRARAIAKIFLHRPAALYVAGETPPEPHYRFIASVPEGQFDAGRRSAIVREITDAVLVAEHGAYPSDPNRVWVFAAEIPDGTWGGAGRIHTLADIAGYVLNDPDKGRRYAEKRLAERRAADALAVATL